MRRNDKILLSVLILLTLLWWHYLDTRPEDGDGSQQSSKAKTILLWNDYAFIYQVSHEPVFKGCAVSDCQIVTDRTRHKEMDAIVFNIATNNFAKECQGDAPECEIPQVKPPNQVWIFHSLEAPCQVFFKGHKNKDMLSNSFNWTFTHRKDSDVYSPLGVIEKRDVPLNRDFREVARKKTKSVGWLVSHCETPSKRELYVKELQKYIEVEILGKCGKPCPYKCLEYINNTHKYYLAFENSLAEGYITEKFFRNVNLDVVLISRSGANYTKLGILPNWHINTADFPTPKALAEYLLELDKDESRYLPYLEWRNQYISTRGLDKPYVSWCDLCAKMHETPRQSKVFSRQEIIDWYYPPGLDRLRGCKIPSDFPEP